jgi:hypothetical protein
MTEEVYHKPVASFAVDATPAPTFSVPVLARGRAALEKINKARARLGRTLGLTSRARSGPGPLCGCAPNPAP